MDPVPAPDDDRPDLAHQHRSTQDRAPRRPGQATPGAFSPWRPFHRRDGLAAGLTKHRLDGSSFTNLFGSIRLAASVPLTPQLLARAATMVVQDAAVSHHTAAVLWGAIVPETPHTHVSVRVDRDRRRREGLRCHVSPCRVTTTHQGLPVTTPAQTFLDLVHHLGLVDLVILGDSLVHVGVATEAELIRAAGSVTGRGGALAREAAQLVRAGSQSPMETRVRLMFRFAGLPEPTTQLRVGDADRTYYLDLAWPELKVAAEYDGRQHAESPRQWGHDLGRREWLDGNGWRLVVLRAPDVYDEPWATILRVQHVLATRGYESSWRSPPALFTEHFPGRPWRQRRGAG